MKILFSIITSILITGLLFTGNLEQNAYAVNAWIPQISGTSFDLFSVDFVDVNTGYAVDNSGKILKTVNGGTTWFFIEFTGIALFSVDFVDVNNGHVVGALGQILRTTDGGTTWTLQTFANPFPQSLLSVSFSDVSNGIIVGNAGTILKTTNGGTTWTVPGFVTSATLLSVDFVDVNTGYAVGVGGTILKTTNGGTTWTQQVSGTTQLLRSVDFVDVNTGYAVGASGTILKTSGSCGLTNPNMFVSTENPLSSNTFGGPMVTEVMICDSDITDTSTAKGEPDVTVNGRILRMTQSIDGNWYGYFADRIQAQIADQIALNGPSGSSLDFGQFCKNTSNVLGIDVSDTNSIAIPVDVVNSGTQGTTPITVDCSGVVISGNTNNVIRESIPINPGTAIPTPPVEIGQIGLANSQFWPFIQLYEFTPTSNVLVQYNKGGNIQSTTLTFDNTEIFASLILDQPTYLPGDDVKVTIFDVQLNIDPTDEDSWTWATLSTGPALFYDLFDENGISTGDAIQTISQDVFINLTNLMFEDNGKLFVEKSFLGSEVLQFEDNNLQNLTPTINGGTAGGLISAIRQPVTFTEQSSSSGTFVNFDASGNSNINVRCDAPSGSSGIIDYNNLPQSILISGSCPPTHPDALAVAFRSLSDAILVMDTDEGTKKSLTSKVNKASDLADKEKFRPAINVLNAFLNQVDAQTGKKITMDDAEILIASIEKIEIAVEKVERDIG